jgi:hypothetical protein
VAAEASLQRRVLRWTKKHFPPTGKGKSRRPQVAIRKNQSTGLGTAGWPDYEFNAINAYTFMIEFKAKGKKASLLQEQRINTLRALGYQVLLGDEFEACTAFISVQMAIAHARPSVAATLNEMLVGAERRSTVTLSRPFWKDHMT